MVLKKVGERDDMIKLQSDDGSVGYFTFWELVRYRGREYALLTDGDDDPIIMAFDESGGEEIYTEILDDAEFEAVAALFEDQPED